MMNPSTLVPPTPPSSKTASHDGKNTSSPRTTSPRSRILWIILRTLLMDLPLLLLFTAYTSLYVLEQVHHDYLEPLRKAMKWTEIRSDTEVTSYHYYCTEDDITANSVEELVAEPDWTTDEMVEHMQVHGVTILPDILTNTTADILRAFIVEENKRQEGFWVINGKNRHSFGIQVDQDESIPAALKEIATHPVLKPMLEQVLGRNPAIIEFTAITSTKGAGMQNFHQDVVPEGSAAKYARSFIPSYSLFIPLQDTTKQMGATQICPGTQMCGDGASAEEICEDYAVSAAGDGVWPKGWGALVNQQTTHRGTAYTDPNGMDRVVFILTFAPRPRYNFNAVESRMIGQGGSYSINWQHWGHTLDDFGHAPTKMALPWRTLRSLGLYKPRGSDWGWDMTTVALMRMANGDNGYTRDTLETFVLEQGGFAWLPTWLQGTVDEEEDEDDWPVDGGWHDFLVTTVQKVKEFLAMSHQLALGLAMVGLLLVSAVVALVQDNAHSGAAVLTRNVVRLLILHGVVLALALQYVTSLSQSNWARLVRSGKLFQPFSDPEIHLVAPATEEDPAPYTLPNRNDVLVAPHYDAWYLASYANILEYSQPGNIIWKELIDDHATGFGGLSPSLQNHLCDFLVFDTMLQRHQGRLLHQMEAGRWTDLLDEVAIAFCRQELLREQHPLTSALMRELDFLKGETKFGVWRHTTMQQSTVTNYLGSWTSRILLAGRNPPSAKEPDERPRATVFVQRIGKRCLFPASTVPATPAKQSKIPSSPPTLNEPFRGAWVTTGDTVEGKYQGEHNEYYKGVLMDASADRDSYDVVYNDGEEDLGLCRSCVRPFKPYQVNETVDVRVDGDSFFKAKIVSVTAVKEEERYRIRFLDDDEDNGTYEVSSRDLRRFL
ncbi:expressed unknown protein [Seminavis robusta]|uniref:Uncharacterized protein n=1 Tax=Seminavis robusta TaxID=568900 RepID=A0A9N8DPJ8_9STRA|nr:expressed unknown protein [Seminavis robusta]|eukprot:Sro247_g098130.1 n/a (888) ;mRNA; r:52017-54763